jgi:hypothetical protein
MRRHENHRSCFGIITLDALIVALALALVACGRPSSSVADAAVDVDAGPDGGVEPPPLRALMSRGLFAQTPVENRFFDPTFAQIDGIAWSPFSPLSYDIAAVTRLHQRTPVGQTALRLERPAGQSFGQVVGMAKGAPGPMQVSVWLGRFEGTNVAGLTVALYGLFETGSGGVGLQPDPEVALVMLDGVTWVYFSAYIAQGPMSWSYLRIVNNDISPLFITAPVLVRVSAQARRLTSGRAPAAIRPLLPVERATWQDWMRRMRDRFGGAPRPFVF